MYALARPGMGIYAPGRYRQRRRGLGDVDCSNLNYPPDPTYANCSAMDQGCVAANGALNTQHNIDVQAYHDAQAACSAQKWAQGGGTVNPVQLTPGAATDYSSMPALPPVVPMAAPPPPPPPLASRPPPAAPTPPPTPTPSTAIPPTAPPSSPVIAAPAAPVVSSGLPPSSSAVAPTGGFTIGGFNLSSIPWWGWAGSAGLLALFAFSGKR